MKLGQCGIIALFSAFFASTSFGETVGVTLVDAPQPGLTRGLRVTADLGGAVRDLTSVGGFEWRVNSDTGANFEVGSNIYTFCIQAFQGTGNAYSVVNLNTSNLPAGGVDAGYIDSVAAAQLQGLIDNYWSAIDFTNTHGTDYSINSTSYTDNQVGAAFQLAVWEIEYDGGAAGDGKSGGETFGSATNYFSTGKLTAVATGTTPRKANGQAAIDLATYWLNNFAPDSNVASLVLTDTNGTGFQDQLYGIPNPSGGNGQAVPLPAALPTGLALLIGLGVFRTVRRKNAMRSGNPV
jgi:hypothetical protein